MSESGRRLSVWIPDLFPRFSSLDQAHPLSTLTLPGLTQLLAKAHSVTLSPPVTPDVWFASAGTLPKAAPMAAAEDLSVSSDEVWVCVDFIELKPDQSTVYCLGYQHLGLTAAERQALIDAIRPLFPQPEQLKQGASGQWYYHSANPVDFSSLPLLELTGKSLQQVCPTGAQAGDWQRLITEIQMTLHHHPVNEQRRAAGLPLANSVWLWGAGRLRSIQRPMEFDCLWSDSAVWGGVAMQAQCPYRPWASFSCADFAPDTSGLVIIEGLTAAVKHGDTQRWQAQMQALESSLWQPLSQWFRQGKLTRMTLHTLPHQTVQLDRADRRRWWRRKQSLHQWLAQHQGGGFDAP